MIIVSFLASSIMAGIIWFIWPEIPPWAIGVILLALSSIMIMLAMIYTDAVADMLDEYQPPEDDRK